MNGPCSRRAPVVGHRSTATRADSELDSIGGGALATDWGQRILSNRSELYDPLSYHYGSVWPLFTGWAASAPTATDGRRSAIRR